MGDEVQAIKAGLLEVADIVVVNKGDRPGAQRTAAQLRAMLVPTVAREDADPSRPAPKRPEVLVTTALTGDGVPGAAGRAGAAPRGRRRRRDVRRRGSRARRRRSARSSPTRLRGGSTTGELAAGTDAAIAAVAGHELDPYAAADRLLEGVRDGAGRPTARRCRPARSSRRPFAALLPSTALAFFIAGGIVLPVAPRFAARSARADAVGVGHRDRRVRARRARDAAGRRAGPRTGSAAGRCSSAARCSPSSRCWLHLAATTLPLFVVVRAAARRRRGVLLRRGAGGRQRPRAPDATRRGDQPRLAVALPRARDRAADRRGRCSARRRLRGRLDRGRGARRASPSPCAGSLPETAPAGRSARPASRVADAPASIRRGLPGLLVLCGAFGMAGLPRVPAAVRRRARPRRRGARRSAVYALIVVVLRLVGAELPDQVGAARLSGAALVVAGGRAAAARPACPTPGRACWSARRSSPAGVAFTFPALLALAVSRVAGRRARRRSSGTASVFLDLAFGLAPAVLGARSPTSAGYRRRVPRCRGVVAGGRRVAARRRGAASPSRPATVAAAAVALRRRWRSSASSSPAPG